MKILERIFITQNEEKLRENPLSKPTHYVVRKNHNLQTTSKKNREINEQKKKNWLEKIMSDPYGYVN